MGCDVLSLQVRDSANKGGYTYLSSAWTVFNDLLNREPEVIKTLLAPNWPVQLYDKPSHSSSPSETLLTRCLGQLRAQSLFLSCACLVLP